MAARRTPPPGRRSSRRARAGPPHRETAVPAPGLARCRPHRRPARRARRRPATLPSTAITAPRSVSVAVGDRGVARRPVRCSRPPASPAGCVRRPRRPARRGSPGTRTAGPYQAVSRSAARHSTASAPCAGAGSITSGPNVSVIAPVRPSRVSPATASTTASRSPVADHPQPGVDVAADRYHPQVRAGAAAVGRPAGVIRCRPVAPVGRVSSVSPSRAHSASDGFSRVGHRGQRQTRRPARSAGP